MKYWLRLFVTGRTIYSRRAIENLRVICASQTDHDFAIEVIDVLEEPDLAENEKVIATPTLIRRRPQPVRKIIGDLSDTERVLMSLDLALSPDRAHPE